MFTVKLLLTVVEMLNTQQVHNKLEDLCSGLLLVHICKNNDMPVPQITPLRMLFARSAKHIVLAPV